MGKPNHNNESDETIVERLIQTKNNNLFEILYNRHAPKVYGNCLFFIKNTVIAADLTHDIFLKAFLSLSTFQKKGKFSSWLYSIAYNYCIDYAKKNEKERKELNQYYTESSEPGDDELFEIKTKQLYEIFDELPVADKIILLMKYQDDYSIEEVAKHFSIGLSAVKMRLARAKSKVLELYKIKFPQIS